MPDQDTFPLPSFVPLTMALASIIRVKARRNLERLVVRCQIARSGLRDASAIRAAVVAILRRMRFHNVEVEVEDLAALPGHEAHITFVYRARQGDGRGNGPFDWVRKKIAKGNAERTGKALWAHLTTVLDDACAQQPLPPATDIVLTLREPEWKDLLDTCQHRDVAQWFDASLKKHGSRLGILEIVGENYQSTSDPPAEIRFRPASAPWGGSTPSAATAPAGDSVATAPSAKRSPAVISGPGEYAGTRLPTASVPATQWMLNPILARCGNGTTIPLADRGPMPISGTLRLGRLTLRAWLGLTDEQLRQFSSQDTKAVAFAATPHGLAVARPNAPEAFVSIEANGVWAPAPGIALNAGRVRLGLPPVAADDGVQLEFEIGVVTP